MIKKKCKILVVSSYYKPAFIYGGPVNSIHRRSIAIRKYADKIITYTTNADGNKDLDLRSDQTIDVDGLPVWYFTRWWFGLTIKPANLFFSPAMGHRLSLLKPGDFDLILIHSTFGDPGRMAALAARRCGIPYVCHTHGSYEPWAIHHKFWRKKIYFTTIEKGILNRAAGIVVSNDSETEQLYHLGIMTKIKRIPWGTDLPEQEKIPSRNKLEKLWPALQGRPFVLFLGRLHRKKGLDILIPAFSNLTREFHDWVLVLAGPDEGGYRQILEQLVRESGLTGNVLFTGMVTSDAKAALLAQAECFVLPSYSEGFPMAVVEAMSYGRPVVITDACHIPEVCEDGAGFVVPPEPKTLEMALREFMRDAHLRQYCGEKAKVIAQKHFTWESVARKIMGFYREVADA